MAAVEEGLLAQETAGKSLAFVGDGVNDAPFLRADVGVIWAFWDLMLLLRLLTRSLPYGRQTHAKLEGRKIARHTLVLPKQILCLLLASNWPF